MKAGVVRCLRPALAAAAACGVLTAHAGRPCEAGALDVPTVRAAMAAAERTARRLEETGADVVVLARKGQDLGRYGVTWSHLGLAYRQGGAWRVVHELNRCGTAESGLYRQGLGEFFLDRLWRYEAALVVPTPDVQARLRPVLQDDGRVARLHTPAYSMVAYPWAETYQQSNQWVLETFAAALEPAASTRRRAQAWLQLQDYRPGVLHLGPLTRLGARATTASVAFDDHPAAKRFGDRIDTATADSVLEWLVRRGFGREVVVVRP